MLSVVLGSSGVKTSAEERLGKYLKEKWRLDELLGLGGTAAVYAATHRNGSRVAIKVLHRHLASERQVRRFLREAYTANLVGHHGAVPVYDDDVDGDDAFLVMELLDGANLKDHAEASGGRLSVEETLKHADQLLDVLKEAHSRGIVHRDIKPSNLFLSRSGDLRVLDFGVAHLRMPLQDEQTTADGDVIGTPAFMAPEQARGRNREVDARADVWSVGATLFTLLSGELVHQASTASEHLGLTMSASARPFSGVRPDLPATLCSLIDRCLRHDPAQRWPAATALQDALRTLDLSSEPARPRARCDSEPGALATATLPANAPTHKSGAWGVLAGGALLAAAAGFLLATAPDRDEAPARLSKTLDTPRQWVVASVASSRPQQAAADRVVLVSSNAPARTRPTLPQSTPRGIHPSTKPRKQVPENIETRSPAEQKKTAPGLAERRHSNNPLDWRH